MDLAPMKKNWLVIVVSIYAVVLIVIASLSNVMSYQTIQSSNQNVIKERINQRELLFLTIFNLAKICGIYNILYAFFLVMKSIGVVFSCWWSAGPP
jgi:uncharacterized membrane protein